MGRVDEKGRNVMVLNIIIIIYYKCGVKFMCDCFLKPRVSSQV